MNELGGTNDYGTARLGASMSTMHTERRVHLSLRRLLLSAAVLALFLGAAKAFAIKTPRQDVFVVGWWIVIVAAIRLVSNWKAAAAVSLATWMVLEASIGLAPDERWRGSSFTAMCVGGCIRGVFYFAIAELLCRAIGWVDKLVCRLWPGTRYEPTAVFSSV